METEDQIIRMLAYEGRVSVICASTTKLVEEARKIQDLSPVMTAAFGRLLTITSIMASEMKSNKDKITVQLKGSGPAGTLLVTANNYPKVKGYVTDQHVDIPLNEFGKLDVSGAIGTEGYINVKRAIYRNMSINIRRNSRRLCRIFCKIRTKKHSSRTRGISK